MVASEGSPEAEASWRLEAYCRWMTDVGQNFGLAPVAAEESGK